VLMQIFAAASAAAGVDCFSDWKFVVVWIFWAANLVLDNWAVSRRREFSQFRSKGRADCCSKQLKFSFSFLLCLSQQLYVLRDM
jgi:hypothetical protein